MDIAKIKKKLMALGSRDRQAKVTEAAASPARVHETEPDEKSHASSVVYTQPEIAEEHSPEASREQWLESEPDTGLKRAEGEESPEESKNGKETPKGRETDKIAGTDKEEVVEILTFGLMKEEFAFRISQLEEILRHQRITRVPRVPKYVIGITSLRGKIIPVLDLKLRLSLTANPSAVDQKGKILIIKGPKGPIGAAVDKVIRVVRTERSEILPPPSHLSEAEHRLIEGVVVVDKRFVSIINIEETVSLCTKWT
jgi:purine-binding chemotaxis protein CheW